MLDLLPPVLETESMREADRRTIEELGISGFTLMELAGRAVADEAVVMHDASSRTRTVVLCGKGNNGGDGFVAARVLQQHGYPVDVYLFARPDALRGDALLHFQIMKRVSEEETGLDIHVVDSAAALPENQVFGLIVDALLGTGLSSDVRSPLDEVIRWINRRPVPVLSVDLPSGLASDDGRVLGTAVRADVTVTMGALKTGLLVNDGPDYSGSVVVADIGIPEFILTSVSDLSERTALCLPGVVYRHLPKRSRDAHKYASGPTLVVGGSADFPGAPVLAATASARIGSGYVVVICPSDVRDMLSEKLTEIPVGSISRRGSAWDFEEMETKLGIRWEKARSLLVGPGLGRAPEAGSLVREVLTRAAVPAVVDADALYLLKDESNFVRQHSDGRWIFTPHAGEFARMYGGDASSPIRAARAFAREWNVVLLLKGMPSITAAPDGRVVVNDTGNPAVATAGTGDVLAGMTAGLLAQGLEPFDAAISAIHIGGAIADEYTTTRSAESMMAGDVLSMIPDFLARHA